MTRAASESDRNTALIFFTRAIHGLFAAFFVICLIYIFYCGISDRVGWLAWAAVCVMIIEGLAIWLNNGLCPLTSLQRRFGDDKGFFDLFLPDKMLKFVVPFFIAATIAGVALLLS